MTTAVVLIAVASLTGVILHVVFAPDDGQRVNRATIWATVLCAAGFIVSVLAWAIRRREGRPSDTQLVVACNHLAIKSLNYWMGEAHARGLDDGGLPFVVQWRANPPERPPVSSPEVRRALSSRPQWVAWYDDQYSQLEAGQTLVVLGKRGAGKTSALLLLLLEVLRRRAGLPAEKQATFPVPVWVTCGSWNPLTASLPGHVATSLARFYPGLLSTECGGKHTSADLVEQGKIVVFLDGLDEMPPDLQSHALKAIQTRKSGQLESGAMQGGALRVILASRTEAYEAAQDKLMVKFKPDRTVELCDVAPADAVTFLSGQSKSNTPGRGWQEVAEHLTAHPDSSLGRALGTPLGLVLARDAQVDPRDLISRTAAGARGMINALFEVFLEQSYPEVLRDDRRRNDCARQRLAWIADQMDTDRDLAWWDIPNAVPDGPMRVLAGAVGAFAGGLTGLLIAMRYGSGMPWTFGLVMAAVFALVSGIPTGLGLMPTNEPASLTIRAPRPRDLGRLLGLMLLVGPVLAVEALGSATMLGLNDPIWLVVLAVTSPVGALLMALLDLWRTPIADSPIATPLHTYQADLRAAILRALTIAMAMGPAFGLIGGVTFGLLAQGAAPRLALAQVLERLRGRGNVPFMTFLEDARNRQVLRQAGTKYQFRHVQLQDYLAQRERDALAAA